MAQGGGEIGAGGIAGDDRQAPRVDPQRAGVVDTQRVAASASASCAGCLCSGARR